MEPFPQLLPSCRLTGQVRNSFQRWGQPGQQQGRRIPSLSSVRTRSMCCLLVSGLLTEMTQQIHSFRASGVMSSHFARARRVRSENFSQIRWYSVYGATRDRCLRHRFQSISNWPKKTETAVLTSASSREAIVFVNPRLCSEKPGPKLASSSLAVQQ